MSSQRAIRLGAIAAIVACTFASMSAASAAGPGLAHYSVHSEDIVVEAVPADDSPCYQDITVTYQRRLNATVAATTTGLTDADVLALLTDDPDGVLRQVTMLGVGDITIEMGGHEFVGTFTQRFDGRFLTNGMYLQSGSLAVTARSELGTLFTLHGMGNDLDGFDGLTKHAFSRGKVVGCLD